MCRCSMVYTIIKFTSRTSEQGKNGTGTNVKLGPNHGIPHSVHDPKRRPNTNKS